MTDKISVLDKGYVRLVDVMGSDLSIVNAARVSFDRESGVLDDHDKRLIRFLAREGHDSPFRHASATFEVYAPLMVARQWWKYVVGSDHTMDSWNESSRRYITENEEFYVPAPDGWRSVPDNVKQGSGEPIPKEIGRKYTEELMHYIDYGMQMYNNALKDGIAPEQARLFLPAYGMYVRWRWTASLQSVCHFLNQRIADDAQHEIAEYARAVHALIEPEFPVSVGEMVKEVGE